MKAVQPKRVHVNNASKRRKVKIKTKAIWYKSNPYWLKLPSKYLHYWNWLPFTIFNRNEAKLVFSFVCSPFCNGKHSVRCSAHDSLKYHRVAFKYLPKSLLMFNVNSSSVFAFVTFSMAHIHSTQCESITFHFNTFYLMWLYNQQKWTQPIDLRSDYSRIFFFVVKKTHTNSIKQRHATVKWPFLIWNSHLPGLDLTWAF